MVYDKANELAKLLKESAEFREYKTTKEKAFENDDVGCSSNSQLVADAPPMQDNPNLRPIGQGFGFLVFIKDIEV